MFLHNLKIAYRNILKSKWYSIINILGLAVGMACSILLLLWVSNEMSFNEFHENKENLYRLVHWPRENAQENIPGVLIESMKKNLPEVALATNYDRWGNRTLIDNGISKRYYNVQSADPDFFKMFSFKIINGDSQKALTEPHTVVVTKTIAQQIFGNEEAVGKSLKFNNQKLYTVVSVVEDIPKNSDIQFDMLIPFEDYKKNYNHLNNWHSNNYMGFIQLKPGIDKDKLGEKLQTYYKDYYKKESQNRLSLQPLKDVHLYTISGADGRIINVRLYTVVALFILLIACFNFINLSTAQASNRAKEIGLKKSIGAKYQQLIMQFIGESLLLTVVAVNFAIIIARLFLPEFNNILHSYLELNYTSLEFIVIVLIIILITGILAGTYPAFYMSSFKPVNVIKGIYKTGNKGNIFRKILVIFQYSLTSGLLIYTIVVSLQIHHMANRDIGLSMDKVIKVTINPDLRKKIPQIKSELVKDVSIESVSILSRPPYSIYQNGWGVSWEGKEPDYDPLITYMSACEGFDDTFKTDMAEGRFFTEKDPFNSPNIVINETFAKMMSNEPVIGKIVKAQGRNATIIGVVKDFNCVSLRQKNQPLIIYKGGYYNYFFIRHKANNRKRAIEYVRKLSKSYSPNFPVKTTMLIDNYRNQYKSMKSSTMIFTYSSILAILISCLGIFGLTSFMAEERTKEFGVRKVLGASLGTLQSIFVKEFSRWIIISTVIAWPVTYWALNNWFQNYPYRIDMPYWIYVLVPVIVFFITLATISYHSVRTARANPVDSLKYE